MTDIREPDVRRWRKNLLDAQVSAVTVAKAYRPLKAIFNTAVDDGLIRRRDGTVRDETIGHAAGTAAGEGVMNIAGQRSNWY